MIGCSLLWACDGKPEGFEVRIRLQNAPEGRIYVSERIPNPEQWFIDTLELTGGEVVYTGKVDYPRLTTFSLWEGQDGFLGNISVFLDNSRVDITGDFNDLPGVTITGSKTNDEYRRIEDQGAELFRRHRELSYQRSRSFKDDPARYDSLSAPYEQAYRDLVGYITSVPGYATSEVAPYFVTEYIPIDNVDDLDRALGMVDESLHTNGYIADAISRLEREKNSIPGRPAPDFELTDLDGKTYRLSDMRGKYVLFEFSASWCGWCKLEVPYLKTVYDHTRGQNFEMFTINVDEERDLWAQDVAEHPVPWPVISDLKGLKGGVAWDYNISGIPMIFLVGPDGVILEKGLRREKMIEYIDRLFDVPKN